MYTIIDDRNLKNIAAAIRKKTKTNEGLRPQDMPNLIEGLRCVGDEIDCLKYAKSFNFSDAVAEVTEDIHLYVENATSLATMAEFTTLNCNKISLHFSDKMTNLTRAFRYTKGELKEIEIIGDTKNVVYWQEAFVCANGAKVEKIIGDLNFSAATNISNAFPSYLQEISIVPNTIKIAFSINSCQYLTESSINSIINGLIDLSGQESLSIYFHKKLVLTDDQKNAIQAKNWTLVQ